MDNQLLLDGHKLLWHLDRVVSWQKGQRIMPLHLDLGITTGCNLGCVYCYGVIQGRTRAKRRYNMPREALIPLLSDAKEVGVRSVAMIGEGENTLNPALYDGLQHASEIRLDAGLASNGLLLKKECLKRILDTLVWLRFNISAATRESYRLIHNVDAFECVVGHMRRAAELKHKSNLAVTIGAQMVVVKENIRDIVPLAKLCREIGVDYLVVKPCSDTATGTLDAPHEAYGAIDDILSAAEEISGGNFNVAIKWRKIKNCGAKDFDTCYGTPFLLQISGDGTVFPCGHFFNVRRDEFALGNIVHQRFREIVQSERYWQVHQKMQRIDVHNGCETNCRHHYLNQFLWKTKNPPAHINFI